MASLSDTARQAYARAARAPSLPSWWMLAGSVAFGIFVVLAALSVISGPRSTDTALPTLVPRGVDPTAVRPSVPQTPATTPTTAAPSSVELATTDGSRVQVPVAAVDVATAAATALFTGNFNDIALAPNTSPRVPAQVWPTPEVRGPLLAAPQQGGTLIRLSFDVDPDGPGAEGSRRVGVNVTGQDRRWAYLPD